MEDKNKNMQQGFSAVKPDEKKKMDGTLIVGIVLVLIIILGAIGYWVFGVDKGARQAAEHAKAELTLDEVEAVLAGLEESGEHAAGSVSGAIDGFSSAYIAVLAAPEVFDHKEAQIRGCDAVLMVKESIKPTKRVLNSALWVLFNDDRDYGFDPGNFISTQENLELRGAVIENGVAKVYLNGSVGPIGDVCDESRIQTQIQETALQFDSVSAVEIFLNNEPLNIQ